MYHKTESECSLYSNLDRLEFKEASITVGISTMGNSNLDRLEFKVCSSSPTCLFASYSNLDRLEFKVESWMEILGGYMIRI